ncbi:MAG: PAS domain S-box protein [Verrucomicrobiota bacterium]|nr:PAS domain S-box protein [Verrucomicrobiota bacterium]
MQEAFRVVSGLNLNHLRLLDQTQGHVDEPLFRRLHGQLQAVSNLNPIWSSCYLLGRKPDGEFYVQLSTQDSFPAPETVPPPLAPDIVAAAEQTYEAGRATVQTVSDSRGSWVTAFIPLVEPHSGEFLMALCVEIAQRDWDRLLSRSMMVPLGFCIALFLVISGILVYTYRRADGIQLRHRHIPVVLTCTLGLILTLLTYWNFQRTGTRYVGDIFSALANRKILHTLNAFRTIQDTKMEVLGRIVENDEFVQIQNFNNNGDWLNQIPGIRYWGWIAAVPQSAVADMEAQMNASGVGGFTVWAPDKDGMPGPPPRKEMYFPVIYMSSPQGVPLFGSLRPGMDVGSREELRPLLEEAAESKLIVSSRLLQPPPDSPMELQPHELIFLPVYSPSRNGTLQGFVFAVFEPEYFLNMVLSHNLDNNQLIEITLSEIEPDGSQRLLASTATNETAALQMPVQEKDEWRATQPITALGKVYIVTAVPTPDYFIAHSDNLRWASLLIGFFLTVIFAYIAHAITRRRKIIEAMVKRRTLALDEVIARHDILDRYSRSFTWLANAEGLLQEISPSVEDILGYTPEELIGKHRTYDFYPPDMREAYRKSIKEKLRSVDSLWEQAQPHLAKNGMHLWVSSHIVPLRDKKGEITGYQGVSTDITDRHIAEEERKLLMAENETITQRYKATIMVSNAGAWEYNKQTGLMHVEKNYFRILGYSDDEFGYMNDTPELPRILTELIHPDDRLSLISSAMAYLENPRAFFQQTVRMRHATGKWVWILFRGQMVSLPDDPSRNIFMGIILDVSHLKGTELALHESEAKYRLITESLHDCVWVADAETLQYLYVSPSSERILGYTAEELMDTRLDFMIPPDRREALLTEIWANTQALWEGRMDKGSYTFHELAMKRKDGSTIHTEIITRYHINPLSGRTEIHGETRDIALRRKAEQALRESEAKYRMLAENVKDIVWIVDVDTRAFTYLSQSISTLFPAHERMEDVPLPHDFGTDPELTEAWLTKARELKEGRITSNDFFTYNDILVREDGEQVSLESVLHFRINPQTEHVEIIGITRDISERKLGERYHEMGIQTLQILNEPKALNDLLQELVEMFKDVSGVDAAGIRIRSGDAYSFSAHAGYPCGFLDKENNLHMYDSEGHLITDEKGQPALRCACGRVLSNRPEGLEHLFTANGTLWTNDALRQLGPTNSQEELPTCLAHHFSSIALAPIKFHNHIVGLIQLNSFKKNAFTPDAILLLEAVAAHIGEAFMRKRAEQDYRILFHEMLESFVVHEVVLDEKGHAVDFRFVAVNPAYERYVNMSAKELLGRKVSEALPWSTKSTENAYRLMQDSDKAVCCQHMTENGNRYEEVTVFRLSPTQFATIFNDVTQRTKAELALHESRRQYAALLSNLPGMAFRYQRDHEGQWRMEFASAGSTELTGYAPSELIGLNLFQNNLIHPAYLEHARALWEKSIRYGRKYADEHEILTKSGEPKWVWEQGECVYDDTGKLVAIEGFVTDITKRKSAESERERLIQAIEQSHETIVITNPEGKIVYVNAAFTSMTGYSREEALDTSMHVFLRKDENEQALQEFQKALIEGTTWEGMFNNIRKNGTHYTEQISISPVRNELGKVIYFVALRRDITQELQNTVEREQLRNQILQTNKMESIGRLAGGIAHDFNNMLQAILGYAEMAMEQVMPEQPLYQDIQAIQNAARHSAELTRQLLIFARRQTVVPKVIRVNEAVENMTGILRRLIGANIQFIWKPGKDNSQIKIDPNQLDQILANLCINARDAIADKGVITVSTRDILIEETLHTASGDVVPGLYAMLAVEDNGIGMSKEIINQIFEPFFTTKKSGKGTGLGLATVYTNFKQCNGGIIVRSQLGKGTTFEILLPSEKSDVGTENTEDAPQVYLPHGKETILLVDDEETILHTTRRMLESIGYTVIATNNPAEALQVIEDGKTPIDLLVSDVIMPQINGPELVQNILKLNPELPFFFISGYTANLHLERTFAKAPKLLFKPFTRQQIASKVRTHLDGRDSPAKGT